MKQRKLSEEEKIEMQQLTDELYDYINETIKDKKVSDFKLPVIDNNGIFDRPDILESSVTESGDLVDDSNPFDEDEW